MDSIDNANETALAVQPEPTALETDMTRPTKSFCSFKPEDNAARAMLYNGMNNPDHRIADEIGAIILARDVYAEKVNVVKPETGEIEEATRVVIFDEKNESHVAVSIGIYNALAKLFLVFGRPTWTEPVPLRVKQIPTSGTKKMLTLEVVKQATNPPAGKK